MPKLDLSDNVRSGLNLLFQKTDSDNSLINGYAVLGAASVFLRDHLIEPGKKIVGVCVRQTML